MDKTWSVCGAQTSITGGSSGECVCVCLGVAKNCSEVC